MKKAVFYGRYSSVNQTEQSIEGQLHVRKSTLTQSHLYVRLVICCRLKIENQ